MSSNDASEIPVPQAARQFASTRWSLVAAAAQRDSPECEAALATLCRLYWYPLYAYARRRLPQAQDAQDLTQEFFACLLDKDYLRQADRQRGRLTPQWQKSPATLMTRDRAEIQDEQHF